MAGRQVTIKDVAKKAGVSTAVVSAAMSGREHNIRMSEETRLRVQQAIIETGYRVNHAAAALRRSRSGVIAAVVPKIANPVFEFAIRGMHDAAEEVGDVLLLADALWIEPGSGLMRRMAGTDMVDGFLIRSAEWGSETTDELTRRDIPFVLLQPPADDELTRVWIDDAAGVFLATKHLLDLGHRRIALVGGPEPSPVPEPRHTGYLAALADHGQAVEGSLIRQTGFDPHELGRATRELLTSDQPPTAMVIDNIVAAPGALVAISDLGVRVPEELSVVVYQDLPAADLMRPAPTTVRMPVYQAGVKAFQTLRRLVDGHRPRSAVVSSPKPKLIDRGSTRSL